MTSSEKTQIEQFRDELNAYHLDVRQHITACASCRTTVDSLDKDIHGIPGKTREYPGLIGMVADLDRSRKMAQLGLRSLWGLLLVIFGAILRNILKNYL